MKPSIEQLKEAVEIVRKGRHEVTWYKEKADEYNKALNLLFSLTEQVIENGVGLSEIDMLITVQRAMQGKMISCRHPEALTTEEVSNFLSWISKEIAQAILKKQKGEK